MYRNVEIKLKKQFKDYSSDHTQFTLEVNKEYVEIHKEKIVWSLLMNDDIILNKCLNEIDLELNDVVGVKGFKDLDNSIIRVLKNNDIIKKNKCFPRFPL